MQQIQQYSIKLHVNDCRLHCAIYIYPLSALLQMENC